MMNHPQILVPNRKIDLHLIIFRKLLGQLLKIFSYLLEKLFSQFSFTRGPVMKSEVHQN